MTAQIGDRLLLNGENLTMFANPLKDFFEMIGDYPSFQNTSTMCLRGYVASWEINDDRLYLVDVHGYFKDGAPVSIGTFFSRPEPTLASWYSGTIRLPRGKVLQMRNWGYASIYERDLLITLVGGVIQKIDTRFNEVATRDNTSTVPTRLLRGWRRWLPSA